MDWLNHPSYTGLRDRLIEIFRSPVYEVRPLRPVLFLCGAGQSPRRDFIAEYLRKHHRDKLVFYADDVWAQIASSPSVNALQMEDQLAILAEVVLIVVESPGTFAELGAFSLSPELRKKLLLILDRRYHGAPSFINTGPVRWVDAESHYAPTIFADFSAISSATKEIEDRLKKIPVKSIYHYHHELERSPKRLLFLVCDLLAIIGPAPMSHCQWYISKILEQEPSWDIGGLTGLAVSLGMLSSINVAGQKYYYRVLEDGALEPFGRRRIKKRMLDLPAERARAISVLQTINSARLALSTMAMAAV